MEHGGLFVAKTKQLSLAGSVAQTQPNYIPMSPRIAQSPQREGGNATKSPWQVMSLRWQDILNTIGQT